MQTVDKRPEEADLNPASNPIYTSAIDNLSILHTKVDVEGELTSLMSLLRSLKVFHCALGVIIEDLSKFALYPLMFIDVLAP